MNPTEIAAVALAKRHAADRDHLTRRWYTADEVGISSNSLRALVTAGYAEVGTRNSSLRGGERNTYRLNGNGRWMVRRIHQRAAQG